MSRELMVVLIVAIVMIASIVRARYRHERRGSREGAFGDEQEAARLREEVKQLRERVQVLERITVEKENSLERQIEALRDRPEIGPR